MLCNNLQQILDYQYQVFFLIVNRYVSIYSIFFNLGIYMTYIFQFLLNLYPVFSPWQVLSYSGAHTGPKP